jgi:hypothetical protein
LPDREPLVYGLTNTSSLVVLPEKVAEEVARDYERISAIHTYGEARQLSLEYLSLPMGDDEADDSEPYDPWECEDFPPRAAGIALDELPEDLDIGEEIDVMAFVPWLYIDPADEEQLLEAARVAGYPIRRDDNLIRAIDQGQT